jgi:hypothetical protein
MVRLRVARTFCIPDIRVRRGLAIFTAQAVEVKCVCGRGRRRAVNQPRPSRGNDESFFFFNSINIRLGVQNPM